MAIRIEPLQVRQLDQAAAAMARAFQDDPGFQFVWPDPKKRAAALRPFLRTGLADALPFGHVSAAYAGDDLVGAAAWLPPGAHPAGLRRQLRSTPGLFRVLAAAPSSMPLLARLGRGLERAFPTGPTWYLVAVGVDPRAARRGVGTRLLEPELRAADRENRRCYLETVSGVNVHWYERLGFRVLSSDWDVLGGGPTYWTMTRP